jgi:protein arginine N-methyltransferase 3
VGSRRRFSLFLLTFVVGLDIYGRIKLINYIRSEVKAGNLEPDVSSASKFDDNKYLKLVLEDDALLYSRDEFDDLADDDAPGAQSAATESAPTAIAQQQESPDAKIKRLEDELSYTQDRFDQYRKLVQGTLDKRWLEIDKSDPGPSEPKGDETYFDSYSYNGMFFSTAQHITAYKRTKVTLKMIYPRNPRDNAEGHDPDGCI